MEEDYSYLVVVVFLLAFGFAMSYFYIKHMPPIKVVIINQPLGL